LPASLYANCADLCNAYYGIRRFGFRQYLHLLELRDSAAPSQTPTPVYLRSLPHPFYIRAGTTDAGEVIHSIAREAYAYRLPPNPVNLVIDAGANVGDTSVWYATRFPTASIFAIEPDPDNFAVLTRNCAPYGDRITSVKAALWPTRNARVTLVPSEMASGISVRESPNERAMTCSTIDPLTILAEANHSEIDIFKIDIEGAELQLFSQDCDEWLRLTRSILIEIHSRDAREAVLSAARRHRFSYETYRDLLVLSRRLI